MYNVTAFRRTRRIKEASILLTAGSTISFDVGRCEHQHGNEHQNKELHECTQRRIITIIPLLHSHSLSLSLRLKWYNVL